MSEQEFLQADQEAMEMGSRNATPKAKRAAEKIARDVGERIATPAAQARNDSGYDCVHCNEDGYANVPVEEEPIKCCDETCGMSRKAIRQENWYHIRCRLRALWRLIIIELLGYAALGGVLVAGMIKGFIPMGAAVPAFVICFMWVAVRFDRWIRGGW